MGARALVVCDGLDLFPPHHHLSERTLSRRSSIRDSSAAIVHVLKRHLSIMDQSVLLDSSPPPTCTLLSRDPHFPPTPKHPPFEFLWSRHSIVIHVICLHSPRLSAVERISTFPSSIATPQNSTANKHLLYRTPLLLLQRYFPKLGSSKTQ